jgi:CRP/FNR family transcriptional regulator, cyclic AMP receptor protein
MAATMDVHSKNAERLFERFGRSYDGGEAIFGEEEEATEVFMILEGRVRVIKRVRLVERDMVILKAGDIFGETALMRGQLHTASAVALGRCRVLAFEIHDFEALLRDQPEIALKLIGQLIRRLHASEERIENMMLRDSQSKVVNTLIKLCQATQPGKDHVMLAISPIELSSRIGLDVDTVKRGILQLKENRYLGIVGEKLEVYDVEALRKLYHLMGMKEDLRKD